MGDRRAFQQQRMEMKQVITTPRGRGVGTRGLWEHLRSVPLLVQSMVVKVVVMLKLLSGRKSGPHLDKPESV